jgi:hypothetical protein
VSLELGLFINVAKFQFQFDKKKKKTIKFESFFNFFKENERKK